jgi:uncharacterized SAM-binding protein YcdF (DUF218 family)
MLDPAALCARSTSQWLSLKGVLSTWFMTPSLVVLPLLAWTGLPWAIPRLRWKRQLSILGAILLLIYCTVLLPPTVAVANLGLVSLLPEDSGVTADAIVVLGRGKELRDSRVEVAAYLWKANRGSLIFASGRGDGPQIVRMVGAKGIPPQVLDEENCSRTTEENARFTAAVLQPQGVRRILLVTDPPHMLRSLLTFRSVGFEVIPHLSPLPSNLAYTKKSFTVFSEYIGLIKYALQGRFLARATPPARNVGTKSKQLSRI